MIHEIIMVVAIIVAAALLLLMEFKTMRSVRKRHEAEIVMFYKVAVNLEKITQHFVGENLSDSDREQLAAVCSNLCDNYCKYCVSNITEDELEEICIGCPINKLIEMAEGEDNE